MRLKMEGIGPIREAEIDLSVPLQVIIGPNNSGKTWFAWAVYVAMVCRKELDGINELVEELFAHPGIKINVDRCNLLEDKNINQIISLIINDIKKCFDVQVGKISIFDVNLKDIDSVNTIFKITEKEVISMISSDKYYIHINSFNIKNGLIDNDVTFSESEINMAIKNINDLYMERLFPLTHIIVAERPGITLFAREIAGNRLSREDLSDPSGRAYPWPIQDGLQTELRRFRNIKHPGLAAIAAALEQTVMGGDIRRDDRGDMHFVPAGTETRVSPQVASSMVKSLARLVEYLRYQAAPGQLLIIDEPELSLHPDNQRAVARALAAAANLGLKIIVTTHSDWFLRELNRLVLASRLPVERLAAHRLEAGQPMKPEDLRIHLFNDGKNTIIPCTKDGFSMGTIDDALNRLNEDEQRMEMDLDAQPPDTLPEDAPDRAAE